MKEKSSKDGENYSLDRFVANLNAQAENEHSAPIFSLVKSDTGLLLSIEVRFTAAAYKWRHLESTWKEMEYRVRVYSHKCMFIVTSPEMLEGGVLTMAIASKNHNFQEKFIAKAIDWLANVFFPRVARC